jgi:hypothetical protein
MFTFIRSKIFKSPGWISENYIRNSDSCNTYLEFEGFCVLRSASLGSSSTLSIDQLHFKVIRSRVNLVPSIHGSFSRLPSLSLHDQKTRRVNKELSTRLYIHWMNKYSSLRNVLLCLDALML